MSRYTCEMEVLPPHPNILFLGDVSPLDSASVEDDFDKKILEAAGVGEVPADSVETDAYSRIPAVFTSLESWPLHVNIRCWACRFTFETRPYFVPTWILGDSALGNLRIGVEGSFCTANCASLYIDDRYPTDHASGKTWQRKEMLAFVLFLFTGVRVHHVPPSPRITRLNEYGGDLNQSEFRNIIRALALPIVEALPPCEKTPCEKTPADSELDELLACLST